MKRSQLIPWLVLGLVLAIGGSGCKSPKKPLTPIPKTVEPIKTPPPVGPVTLPPVDNARPLPLPDNNLTSTNIPPPINPEGIGLAYRDKFEGREMDRVTFQADTAYFDFDMSEVKPSEMYKVQSVADYLNKTENNQSDLLIEGHCDERGTEEYNRALGERRALALREKLVALGVNAGRIRTLSFGEDKPADPGHNEAAWAKNRRGEFVRLLPKP